MNQGFALVCFLPSACFAVKYSLFKYSVADCILKGLLIQIIEKNNNTFCRTVVVFGLVYRITEKHFQRV